MDLCRDAKLEGKDHILITVDKNVAQEIMNHHSSFAQGAAVVINKDGTAKVRVSVNRLDEILNNPKPQSNYLEV